MARTLLRSIAVAVGSGLAAGRPALPSLQRLMDRMDRMEARIAMAEARPAAEPSAEVAAMRAALARINDRLAAQSREIELLRIRADEAEKLADAEIRLSERRFREVAATLPAEIEAVVAPRVENLRLRLHSEMQASVVTAIAGFEQSIDTRVSSRMSVLEHQLLELTASLAELRHRAGLTDTNLQKLIEAVERLCDKHETDLIQQAAASEPTFLDLPFERHLKEALADTPATVVAISEAALSTRA